MIFASSISIWMNCSSCEKLGWIILRATYFSNPAMPVGLGQVDLGHPADRDLLHQTVGSELPLCHRPAPR